MFVFFQEKCLRPTEDCPDGFYAEWLGKNELGWLKPLSGKEICRRCHPRCSKCTAYGFHEGACTECVHYKRGRTCEEECPSNYYPDNSTHQCLPCSSECIECTGPLSTDCVSCRNMKVYLVSIRIGFFGPSGIESRLMDFRYSLELTPLQTRPFSTVPLSVQRISLTSLFRQIMVNRIAPSNRVY